MGRATFPQNPWEWENRKFCQKMCGAMEEMGELIEIRGEYFLSKDFICSAEGIVQTVLVS